MVSISIVQITLIMSEQSPEDFCFEIIGMSLSNKYPWDNLSENDKLAHPASIYFFKVNNRNARKKGQTCSKSTIKTPERCHCRSFGVFTNYDKNSFFFFFFFNYAVWSGRGDWLTLDIFHIFFYCFYCWLWTSKCKLGIYWKDISKILQVRRRFHTEFLWQFSHRDFFAIIRFIIRRRHSTVSNVVEQRI